MRLLLLLFLVACAQPRQLRVFAAASLTDALTEVGVRYEERTGQKVAFNFAASSTLARQIEEGAPADLFLSADEVSMSRVAVAERQTVLSNTLVVVGVGVHTSRDLIGRRVALAEPSIVPAGVYAKEYLTRIGIWSEVEPNVIPCENVRAALAAVRAGNADAAVVYKTDARDGYAFEIPQGEGPAISYPFAVLRDSEQPREARAFFTYLRSRESLAIFARHGFVIR